MGDDWREKQAKLRRESKPQFQVGDQVMIYKPGIINRIEWSCVGEGWEYGVDLGKVGYATVNESGIEKVAV